MKSTKKVQINNAIQELLHKEYENAAQKAMMFQELDGLNRSFINNIKSIYNSYGNKLEPELLNHAEWIQIFTEGRLVESNSWVDAKAFQLNFFNECKSESPLDNLQGLAQ